MADRTDKVLSVENLVINFRTDHGILKAIRNVSFDLYEGETLCIVGESGSGKSVTSKAIMGILANNAIIENGSILYRGENLLEVSEEEFCKIRGHRIGMVFQDPLSALNPTVKIGKQITEAMLIHSDKLKTMYNDLISDDLIRYRNTLARMNIAISTERKKLEALEAEMKSRKALTLAQKAEDKLLLQQKKAAFRAFERETRAKYAEEAKRCKAVLAETKKRAKKQVAEYRRKLTGEYREKTRAMRRKLALSSGPEEKVRVKAELAAAREKFEKEVRLTAAEAKAQALQLMKEVGIPEPEKRYSQYPFELSGGMRQRIVIAIALAASPEILICDEPTTALDVTIQSQILELINRIKAERKLSCIFITHDLGVVANMADRVAVMYAGKIVEYGKTEEIFFDPRHPYTWALLASIPDVDSKEKLESIPGTPPDMIRPPKGDAFAPRNPYAMNIDFREEPPFFAITETHSAATWLEDPHAPKMEKPRIVSERIRISLEGAAHE